MCDPEFHAYAPTRGTRPVLILRQSPMFMLCGARPGDRALYVDKIEAVLIENLS
jgi:hypothetical protein